ncbi:MAG: hypothetical protein JJT77_08755 [Crocinitomicaceae bacterium]|nr:hypothetical protein [Crocinitomicaceae bacterium]
MAIKKYFLTDENSLTSLSDDDLKYVKEQVDHLLLWHTDFKSYLKKDVLFSFIFHKTASKKY